MTAPDAGVSSAGRATYGVSGAGLGVVGALLLLALIAAVALGFSLGRTLGEIEGRMQPTAVVGSAG